MRCNKIRGWLTEYAYGDLHDTATRQVESHLSACPSCTAALREVKGVLSLASRYEEVEPPEEAYVDIRREMVSRLRSRVPRLSLLLRPVPAYAAAAAIAFLAVISGIGTKTELVRLERMNALLSDSLTILNSLYVSPDSTTLPDSATSTTPPSPR